MQIWVGLLVGMIAHLTLETISRKCRARGRRWIHPLPGTDRCGLCTSEPKQSASEIGHDEAAATELGSEALSKEEEGTPRSSNSCEG